MKNLLYCLLLFSILSTGCGSDNDPAVKSALQNASFTYHTPNDAKLAERAANLLPKITVACPGLNQYAADLSVADVEMTYLRGYEGGLAFKFVVSDNPRVLPDSIRSYSKSHTCLINVKGDGTKIYIGKSACHSICYGNPRKNDQGLMGCEFLLAK